MLGEGEDVKQHWQLLPLSGQDVLKFAEGEYAYRLDGASVGIEQSISSFLNLGKVSLSLSLSISPPTPVFPLLV